jgi:hypothetical protein
MSGDHFQIPWIIHVFNYLCYFSPPLVWIMEGSIYLKKLFEKVQLLHKGNIIILNVTFPLVKIQLPVSVFAGNLNRLFPNDTS